MRASAGSVPATQIVAKSPADGYTLGSTGNRMWIIRHIFRDQIIHRRRPA